jgi:hypothetical protein
MAVICAAYVRLAMTRPHVRHLAVFIEQSEFSSLEMDFGGKCLDLRISEWAAEIASAIQSSHTPVNWERW